MASLNIKSRLVRSQHSLFQDAGVLALRNDAPADTVRALMNRRQEADAVTGAMVEVESALPERASCQIVHIESAAAI